MNEDNYDRWLVGGQYVRLLWRKSSSFDICLMTQHFHLTLGRLTLEVDW